MRCGGKSSVVEHDRDPDIGAMQHSQIAPAPEELGFGLLGLDVPRGVDLWTDRSRRVGAGHRWGG